MVLGDKGQANPTPRLMASKTLAWLLTSPCDSPALGTSEQRASKGQVTLEDRDDWGHHTAGSHSSAGYHYLLTTLRTQVALSLWEPL